jgi:hypothetical protein
MAKRGRRSHKGGRQASQHRRQARPGPSRRRGPADLLSDVAKRLAAGEPLEVLGYVSTLLAALDPRGKNPFEREPVGQPEGATLPTLVESFAGRAAGDYGAAGCDSRPRPG